MKLGIAAKILVAIWIISPFAAGQDEARTGVLQIRSILHDPLRPLADLYVADPGNAMVKVKLAAEGLTDPQPVAPSNGSLMIYTSAERDPANPKKNLAGAVKIPEGARRLIVVIVAAPKDSNPPYSLVVIDDSSRAFPGGESRVINLTPAEFAIEAGEHRVGLTPGKVTAVPPVKKVDEFNHAQTNFYFRSGEKWEKFTERQIQYMEEMRRIFLIFRTPGATQPALRTIVDHAPLAAPNS